MPEDLTDVQAEGSSASELQDVTAAESSTAEPSDATADSSTAEGGKTPSLIDIVDKALGVEASPTSDESRETKPKEPKADKVDDELPDEPTPEEIASMAPKSQRRVYKLLDERVELRKQVEAIEPKARQWDQIEKFRAENGLSPEGIANAIQIAGLIENEPERAYEVITKLYDHLANKVGAALPEELREAVKRGEITRERAYELSKARASAAYTREQQQAVEARRRQQDEATRLHGQVESLTSVSTEWDKAKSVSDPDWMLKRQEVAEKVQLRLMRDGMPATAEAMRALLDEEAKKVDGFAGKFRTPARAITPSPIGGSSRGTPPAKPKDHYDVVNIALGG